MIRCLVAGLICAGASGALASGGSVSEGHNPYASIVVQNVFRLRPEVKVIASEIKPIPPPPARLSFRVTGFTDVCGRSQVLLEVFEQGKAVVRRILALGEQFMGIEAESIDVAGMRARLNVNGQFTDATFSSNSASSAELLDLKLPRK